MVCSVARRCACRQPYTPFDKDSSGLEIWFRARCCSTLLRRLFLALSLAISFVCSLARSLAWLSNAARTIRQPPIWLVG